MSIFDEIAKRSSILKGFEIISEDLEFLSKNEIIPDSINIKNNRLENFVCKLAAKVFKPIKIGEDFFEPLFPFRVGDSWDEKFFNIGKKLGLGRYHFLRIHASIGIFVNFESCSSYLIQLIIQRILDLALVSSIGAPKSEEIEVGNGKLENLIESKTIDIFDTKIIVVFHSPSINNKKIIPEWSELKNSFIFEQIPIRFFGSKNKVLKEILTAILLFTNKNDIIGDIFAGTCSIGMNLSKYRKVIINDSLLFSKYLANAFSNTIDADILYDSLKKIRIFYDHNEEELNKIFSKELEKERKIFWEPRTRSIVEDYQIWIKQYPVFSDEREQLNLDANETINFERAKQDIEKRRKENTLFPYCLITYYFANAYFGLKQAIELDSLIYGIHQFMKDFTNDEIIFQKLNSLLISAVIIVASKISSSNGHFAKYPTVFTPKNIKYIWEIRRERDTWHLFQEKLLYLLENNTQNIVGAYNLDWRTFFDSIAQYENIPKPTWIFADPPMWEWQYSRFYHLFETLILYDYPKSHHKGLYRDYQNISNFSSKYKSEQEIKEFIQRSSDLRLNLFFTYSQSGLVPINKIISFLSKYYEKIFIVTYSSQGKTLKNSQRGKLDWMFICINKRQRNTKFFKTKSGSLQYLIN